MKDQQQNGNPQLNGERNLIDRLSIVQLKEVKIPEHKEEYAQEIKDIVHDIDELLKENWKQIDGDFVRAVVVLSQMNTHIWHNESNYRKGNCWR